MKDEHRERLIDKLSDTMDPDNARAFVDEMCREDPTPGEMIERWYAMGREAASAAQAGSCYPPESIAHHWWSRGFQWMTANLRYQDETARADRAEAEVVRLRAALVGCVSEDAVCGDCAHELSYHIRAGCGIEQCGCQAFRWKGRHEN